MSESHIRITNDFFRTPEYIKFFKLAKSSVYYFLRTSIIRESKEVKKGEMGGGYYIYKNHFCKNELVARYSQERMAEYLQTSQSRITGYLNDLEKDGFIKIIRRKVPSGMICYYQFGNWSGTYGESSYKETFWLDEHFLNCIRNKQKVEQAKSTIRFVNSWNNDYMLLDLVEPKNPEKDSIAKVRKSFDKMKIEAQNIIDSQGIYRGDIPYIPS